MRQPDFLLTFLCMAVLTLAAPSRAEKLQRFESAVSGSGGSSRPSSHSSSYGAEDVIAHIIIDGLFEGFFYGLVYGGFNSVALLHPEAQTEGKIGTRRMGDALIPFGSFEGGYQDIEGDVIAWDYRVEFGYACLGMSWRKTYYREDDTDFDLDIAQVHGLYRMTFGEALEMGVGFGSLEIKGEERNSCFSFTTPIRVHLKEGVGVEYRPVWSTIDEERFYDNDLALVLGSRYAFVRLGYRWFYHADESLSGFQFGGGVKW